MNKELIETLRRIADEKQALLKNSNYSTAYRDEIRQEIKALQDAADLIEKLDQLAYSWKKIFGI